MPPSIIKYLERGPSTSKEIQAATGLSQTTIARKIRKMGDQVIAIPDGRTVKYAATCNAFNSGNNIPLSIIDEVGKPHLIAHLRPLIHGGYFVEPVKKLPSLLLGESRIGLYEDLPYFLYDLRPQGFLGRQVAKRIASQCDDFPSDPRNWNSNHIGRYLISNGDDLPGNFIFGDRGLIGVGPQFLPVTEANNSDMHLGNLSLSIHNDMFRLLPIYDMCSMGFAPKRSGEVSPFIFDPPDPDSIGLSEDQRGIVIEAAYEFWERVSMDSKISDQFGEYLQEGNPVEHLISTRK